MDKWDKRFLSLAKEIATWSKDPSTQVGAVAIGDKGEVLAQGYNGFPRGVKDLKERYENKDIKYRYVVHAEMNCIYNATYNGIGLDGATMYVWGLPLCNECAKGIIQVGIARVVSPKLETHLSRWKVSCLNAMDMLKEVEIEYDFYFMDFSLV